MSTKLVVWWFNSYYFSAPRQLEASLVIQLCSPLILWLLLPVNHTATPPFLTDYREGWGRKEIRWANGTINAVDYIHNSLCITSCPDKVRNARK